MKISPKLIAAGLMVGSVSLFFSDYANGSSIKPPAAKTGSLVDGGKTCMENCHVGGVIPLTTGISTDIPVGGYVAGQTYSITVGEGMGRRGIGTYGFEFSAQDSLGNLLGEFTTSAGTIGYIPGKYIAHSSPQQASDPSWTFQWEAPSTGSGQVDFYLAVLAGNGNGSTSGDSVLTTNSSVVELGTLGVAGISSQSKIQAVLKSNVLTLHYQNQMEKSYSVLLNDINGVVIHQGNIQLPSGSGSAKIVIGQLPSHGMHVLSLKNDTEQVSLKLLAQY